MCDSPSSSLPSGGSSSTMEEAIRRLREIHRQQIRPRIRQLTLLLIHRPLHRLTLQLIRLQLPRDIRRQTRHHPIRLQIHLPPDEILPQAQVLEEPRRT